MIGIYHLKLDGKVIYIGQSLNINKRVQSHRMDGKIFDGYEIFECEVKDLDELEKGAIVEFAPLLNKSLNPKNASNTNLAKFYGLTRQTIGTYKKEKTILYAAMKEYFIKEHNDKNKEN